MDALKFGQGLVALPPVSSALGWTLNLTTLRYAYDTARSNES